MQKLTYLEKQKIYSLWKDEEILNIQSLLNKKHSLYLDDEEFILEVGTSKEQIQIKIVLIKKNNIASYPIECIYLKETAKEEEQDIVLKMIDYLDIYWANYFSEERNVFVPIDWSKHEFEGICFYMRGFLRNIELENAANEFLNKHGHGDYEIHAITSEM